MQLSDQACGALMMALQNSLMNQTDILPVLKGFGFMFDHDTGLVVVNPPVVEFDDDEPEEQDEDGSAIFKAYVDVISEEDTRTSSVDVVPENDGCSG